MPRTAAKAHQQALSLPSVEAWLYQVLQDGAIEQRAQNGLPGAKEEWQKDGLIVTKDSAYAAYEGFSIRHRDYRPVGKSNWAKKLRALLGPHLASVRPGNMGRIRTFHFAPLPTCRQRFGSQVGADFEWEPDYSDPSAGDEAVSPDAPRTADDPTSATASPGLIQPSEVAQMAKDIGAAERFVNTRR